MPAKTMRRYKRELPIMSSGVFSSLSTGWANTWLRTSIPTAAIPQRVAEAPMVLDNSL